MGFPTKNDVTSCMMMSKRHLHLLVKKNRIKVMLRIQEKCLSVTARKPKKTAFGLKHFHSTKETTNISKNSFQAINTSSFHLLSAQTQEDQTCLQFACQNENS